MIRLGVNIDHVATLRNARGETHPSPTNAAKLVKIAGADSITIHLREDRRHINDFDAKKICSIKKLPVNLEISTNLNIVRIALKIKPDFVCIVPENRKEITTEGGLNLNFNKLFLKKIIYKLKKNKSRVSLFIEPNEKDIRKAKLLNVDCIEIHTGKFCNLVNDNKNFKNELEKIKKSVALANKIGLEVHAGHGLTYASAKILSKTIGIKEFNIGHFLVGESIFVGLASCIKQFKRIIK